MIINVVASDIYSPRTGSYVNERNIRGHLITLLTPELSIAYFAAIQIHDPWNLQTSLQPLSSETSQVQPLKCKVWDFQLPSKLGQWR